MWVPPAAALPLCCQPELQIQRLRQERQLQSPALLHQAKQDGMAEVPVGGRTPLLQLKELHVC